MIVLSVRACRVKLTWSATFAAYALTTGTFVLPAGRVGDLYGHKNLLVGAYVWFSISSLITGLSVYSKSFVFYSVCRGLQGLACAVLVPCALAILGTVYKDGPRKNLVFGFFAAGSPIGFTIGSVFSALLAQLAWWPWMYYLTAIMCCLFSLLSYFVIPDVPSHGDESSEKKSESKLGGYKNFDWLGSLTGVAGLVLFNVAWNRAPAVGWQAADVLTTFISGLALFVAFVYIEHKAAYPLIPMRDMSKDAALVLIVTPLGWSSFGEHDSG